MRNSWLFAALIILLLLPACSSGQDAAPLPAAISGTEGGLYPVQDLSIIAATNRVQFLNVYANW